MLNNHPYSYHLITYGCQMNHSDSERIHTLLQKSGFKKLPKDKAQIIIYNACSVRQSAIDRIWGNLNQDKKNNKIVILTGCVLPNDKTKFSQKVDLILNITDLPNWPDKISQTIKPEKNKSYHQPKHRACHDNYFYISAQHQSNYSAYVPIMTGCNNFCTYCVVPYTRGREHSRAANKIIKEIKKLIKHNYQEIILLGQNVNSYNSILFSTNKKTNFPQLIKMIDTIPGNYWLNFTSSHPKDLSDELIELFKTSQHLTPYLHLALQSGSNKIIKKMNRRYTAGEYKKLIKKLRKLNPGMAISTDIIVGFPGETQKDFEATAKLMQDVKFDMAYIAKYSPRPNTAAANLKDDVSQTEKKKREKILTQILKQTALERNQFLIGQTVKILIDKINLNNNTSTIIGHTNQFKHVKIKPINNPPLTKNHIGQFIQAKITSATPWHLTAEAP